MILVTLGTIPYPFSRAIEWLDTLLQNNAIESPVFVQYGVSNVDILQARAQPLTLRSLVDASEFVELIDKATLVISHAGQGSTRLLASRGARFILIPRLKKYGEHVDDHQHMFCQAVSSLGIQYCLSFQELEQAVIEPPPQLPRNLFAAPKLVDHLQKTYP
jgi:UDP-N-acetylglucosamine transferase subunit ALG13